MSLKHWLFGFEEPGRETPLGTAPPPSPERTASDPAPVKTGTEESSSGKRQDSATPIVTLPDGEIPPPAADIDQTQILTREQIQALSAEDRGKSKPIKFVPPPKPQASDNSSAPPPASEPPSPEPSPTAPAPAKAVKAATWRVEPVNEPWAPEGVANAVPQLAAHIYSDHEFVERILPGWRLLGASRRGRKQAHDARFREDAMCFGSTPEVTVLTVADGAGSSRLSRIGAHVAVCKTVDHLLAAARDLPPDKRKNSPELESALKSVLTAAVKAARNAVLEIAEKSSLNPKEFRATLLTVVHWRDGQNELLLSNQVGDGAIAVLRSDRSVQKFGDSDSGAFSGEVSCFLTDAEAETKAASIRVIADVEQVEALFLCSDGIEDPFYPIEKKAGDIFRQWHLGVTEPMEGFKCQPAQDAVFEEEAAAGALARWLEFEKRGENDDRTVMLLHRLPLRVKF